MQTETEQPQPAKTKKSPRRKTTTPTISRAQSHSRPVPTMSQDRELRAALLNWNSRLEEQGLPLTTWGAEYTHAKGLKQPQRAHNTPLILAMVPFAQNAEELAQKSDHPFDGSFKRRLVHLTKHQGLPLRFTR